MILTVVGKPGGGKSFYALRNIARVLSETQQSVATNLSVDIPALEAYISRRYPERIIDVAKRVRILDERQAARFWLYRLDSSGNYHDLRDVAREEEKRGVRVDYAAITGANAAALGAGLPRVYPGMFYVIDECHVFFDARAWADTGFSLTFYNSQHRKLDDDVIFVTQFLELIDKRVKGFSQEFIYLRNNGAEKLFTFFRGPSYFSAKHYQRPPTGLQDCPSEVHRFGLDLELAKCYDTSAGVGIRGVGKPEARKKRGLPVGFLAIPFLVFCVGLFYLPDLVARGVLGTKSGRQTAETLGIAERRGAPANGVSVDAPSVVAARSGDRAGVVPPTGRVVDAAEVVEPYATGYLRTQTRVIVQMSDGTWRGERDVELTRIDRNGAWIDGKKQFFRAAPRSSPPPSAPVADRPAPEAVTPAPVVAVDTDTWDASTGPIGRPSGRIATRL